MEGGQGSSAEDASPTPMQLRAETRVGNRERAVSLNRYRLLQSIEPSAFLQSRCQPLSITRTSCHVTGTSIIGIPNRAARYSSSTSNAHRSMCWTGNIRLTAARVNILKPHCVSSMPWPPTCK